jgi:carboxymethylenebutenolidase
VSQIQTEKILQIPTADGQMETFVAHPRSGGPFPAVVLYMDAPGIREELYDFARRIAGVGYYCLLPDLYYRRGRVRLDLREMDAEVRKQMFEHMRSLSNQLVLADTNALLNALESESEAAPGPKGCIGYCMSGQFVMSVAGTFPDHFKASVSCYGVGIVTDAEDTPHELARNLAGEIFFAFAEKDEYVPEADIEILRQTLEDHRVDYQLEIYPGTEHGFCFPQRSWCYVEDAAEDVWRRSFEIFDRQLKSRGPS